VKTSTEQDHAERILAVLLAIEHRLDDELGAEQLARTA
jgi:hypothetical protein